MADGMADEAITTALHRLDAALRRVERSMPGLLEARHANTAMADNVSRMRAAIGQAVADIDALTSDDESADRGGVHRG